MSFYITLPSNSSFNDFPNNTLTHYITKLKNPIRLNGNYEVALAQIIFPKNWKYRQDGSILINHPERSTRINVEFYVWETISELINKLTENIILLAEVHVEFKFDKNSSKVFLAKELAESTITLLKNTSEANFNQIYQKSIDMAEKNNVKETPQTNSKSIVM